MSLHESSWLMTFTQDAVGIWGTVKGREITRIKWPKCIDSSFGAEQSSMRRPPSGFESPNNTRPCGDTKGSMRHFMPGFNYVGKPEVARLLESVCLPVSRANRWIKLSHLKNLFPQTLGKRQVRSLGVSQEFLGQSCSGSPLRVGASQTPILSASWLMTVTFHGQFGNRQ